MFTGLIEAVGKIGDLKPAGSGRRVFVETKLEVHESDSVAVDGVCLTVEKVEPDGFWTYMSPETLRVSKFGRTLSIGMAVNLERALEVGARMGGHFVLGHVDAIGRLIAVRPNRETTAWEIEVLNPKLAKYLVFKGSIAVDGVSLTINEVYGVRFKVQLIPYTLEHTTFKAKHIGDIFNLEFDIIAKYVEKFVAERVTR